MIFSILWYVQYKHIDDGNPQWCNVNLQQYLSYFVINCMINTGVRMRCKDFLSQYHT